MLALLTACFLLGLLMGSYLPFFPVTVFCLLVVIGLAVTRLEWKERIAAREGLLCFAVVLAGTCYWPAYNFAASGGISLPPSIDEEPTRIVGRVTEPVRRISGQHILVIEVSETGTPPVATPILGRVRLTWRQPDVPVLQGDVIEYQGRLHPPHGLNNPGGFDFAAYLAGQGIVAVSSFTGPGRLHRLESGLDSWRWAPWATIDSWRLLVQQAAEASLDQPLRGLFLGIILGEQHELPARIRDAFMTTGTVHILSISGSHLGLIAFLTFVIVRALCRPLPNRWTLTLNRWRLTGTRLAILATVPVVVGYALLAGAEVATRRALVMVLAFLFAAWSGRDKPLLPILSLTALSMLLVNPQALFDVSFQLSYLSVLAIALYLSLRAEDPESDSSSFDPAPTVPLRSFRPNWGRAGQWLIQSLLLSLAITLVTLPLVARYFHQFAWISPFANLVIVPLAGFVVVPVGLVSALWLLASGGEGLPLVQLNEAVLRLLTNTTELWATIPAVDRHVAAPSLLMLCAYYALLALTVRPDSQKPTRLAAIGSLAVLLLWWAMSPVTTLLPGQVRVTFLDVGQGDATVIQLAGDQDDQRDQTIVIDGGGHYGQFDLGASVVGPYLWDQGIHRIDHLIGTHPQLDHIGGIPWLIRHFEVARYWGNGVPRSEAFYLDLRQALSEKGLNELIPAAGETIAAEGGCVLSIVSPMPSEITPVGVEWSPRSGSALNNLSVASRLECGAASFLFAADLERPSLARLVQQGLAPRTQVVKVPHHGAASSLDLAWMRATAPEIAVLSVGRYNPYRHPHPQVLASYQAQGSLLFRTDRDGAITITGSAGSQHLLISSASQLKFERVSLTKTVWEQERRNYHRVCLRQFGPACWRAREPERLRPDPPNRTSSY